MKHQIPIEEQLKSQRRCWPWPLLGIDFVNRVYENWHHCCVNPTKFSKFSWSNLFFEEDFNIFLFFIFAIVSPSKMVWNLYLNKFAFLLSIMLCLKFGWHWHSGSGEEDFLMQSIYYLFCWYLPLEKGVALHLKKEKQNLNPFVRMLCTKFG